MSLSKAERDALPDKLSGIYAIRHVDGRVYIGSSVNMRMRWRKHRECLNKGKSHSPHLQAAWSKYGAAAFSFEVLEVVPGEQLKAREQQWIDRLKPYLTEHGFNCSKTTNGPDADACRRAQAASVSARKRNGTYSFTEGHLKAMAESQRGKIMPDHVKAKIAEAHRDLSKNDPARAAHLKSLADRMRGVPKSAEHRQAISDAQRGRPGRKWTDEQKARVAEAMRRRRPTAAGERRRSAIG